MPKVEVLNDLWPRTQLPHRPFYYDQERLIGAGIDGILVDNVGIISFFGHERLVDISATEAGDLNIRFRNGHLTPDVATYQLSAIELRAHFIYAADLPDPVAI